MAQSVGARRVLGIQVGKLRPKEGSPHISTLEKVWVSFLSGRFDFTSLALSQAVCPGPPHLWVADQRRRCHKTRFLGDPPPKLKTFQAW